MLSKLRGGDRVTRADWLELLSGSGYGGIGRVRASDYQHGNIIDVWGLLDDGIILAVHSNVHILE